MKEKTRKLIAPIIITTFLVCYFLFYIVGISFISEIPIFISILLILISFYLIILSISMLVERIKEIKDGEEDDLGKY